MMRGEAARDARACGIASRSNYSYLSASIGSRRDARRAG